jgi:hypothetical protein
MVVQLSEMPTQFVFARRLAEFRATLLLANGTPSAQGAR